VDEAHALGLYGDAGAGVLASLGLSSKAGALVGTFGKSLGAAGAFVAGSSLLRELLVNRARSFVFSTAPSPLSVAAVEVALPVVAAGERRAAAWRAAGWMAAALEARGWWQGPARSLIFPIVVGAPERAVALCAALRERGYFVQAIRPPTVPVDTSRLRVTVEATMTEETVSGFVEALDASAWSLGIERRAGSHVG
jgi:7-keto-8-aminopelargonate synthetase-like enzyme